MKIFKKISCAFKGHLLQFEKYYSSKNTVLKCLRCGKKYVIGDATNYLLLPLSKKDEEFCDEAEGKLKALEMLGNIKFQSLSDFTNSLNFIKTGNKQKFSIFSKEEQLEIKQMYDETKGDDDDNIYGS